ncbi:MAG: phosphatase PAP2 family protein [Planctomycetaceae bacterium]|nr:phosphatase PAP2 family protein [Planctomycetaceae bacterium]
MTRPTPLPRENQPLFAAPSRGQLSASIMAALFLAGLFAIVYGGCDYVTGLRTARLRIDFAFEQRIPFMPGLSPVYSSLYLMFLAMPFVLHSKQQLRSYVGAMSLITCVAGVGFLLIPARLEFSVPADQHQLPVAYRIADWLNLTYNLCPSLHVAYAVFHAELFRYQRLKLTWLFRSWACAVALAAWLTHQHHLVDLIVGCLVGLFGWTRFRFACETSVRRNPIPGQIEIA